MQNKRFYSLDFLKFISAILIIFHHYQQTFKVRYDGINFFDGIVNFGYIVELFFILSGFFMAMKTERYAKEPFNSFIVKRVLRFLPMVWITITVQAITLTFYKVLIHETLSPIGIWKYIKSLTLIFDAGIIKSGGLGFNNPVWYLGVLIICYVLFWSVIHSSVGRKYGYCSVYIFIILIGLGVKSYDVEFPFLNGDTARGTIPFFVGCLLYYVFEKADRKRSAIVSFLLLMMSVITFLAARKTFYDDLQMILVFLIYPSLIIFLLQSRVADTLLNHKFFGTLGGISFEMYIWHVPCFSFVKLLAALQVLDMPSSFAEMIILTLIIIALSTVMYLFAERPLNRKVSACLHIE